MKTNLRKALSLAAISPLVIAASCSSDPKARGQIMIAISSDMSVPENMDEVVVEILSEDGIKQSRDYLIRPNQPGQPMPGTIAIVPPNSGGQQLRVRVIGRLNKGRAEPRVLREALVVVPKDRVGLLHMPIRWLCDDELPVDDLGNVINDCPENQTCKAGSCEDADYTAVELPEYSPQAVYGGGNENGEGGTCFNVTTCFGKGVDVALDRATCTVPLPSGGEGVSVGIVPTDPTKGICPESDGPGDCYVPIDRDDEDGWKEVGGRIQLPRSLCTGPKASQVGRVVLTTACATKGLGTPICGPWTNVKSVAPVGPQTPPITSGRDGDGGVVPSDDGGVVPREEGGVVVPPRDGGVGGASGLPEGGGEGGTCADESAIPLAQAPAGAMFILLDGSSQMTQTGASVPSSLIEWMASAATKTPTIGIGFGVGMHNCGDPLTSSFPVVPAGVTPAVSFGEFGMGDFPLEEGLNEAERELSRWGSGAGERRAIIVVSAQGPLSCSTPTLNEMAASFAVNGIKTHVLSPGPGSTLLSNLAVAGETGGAVTFSDRPGLLFSLDNIATGLSAPCTFQAPPGGPGATIVTLENPDLGKVVLEYRGDLGCADSPGYMPDPFGDPRYIHICPTTCVELQRVPGSLVAAEAAGGCMPPPLGAGGRGAGVGGSPGAAGAASGVGGGVNQGGRAGFGGSPGSAGAASDVDAGPGGPGGDGQGGGAATIDAGTPIRACAVAQCPTPGQGVACCITPDGPCDADLGTGCGCPTLAPASFDPCGFDGQHCTYEAGAMCDCSVGEGWLCTFP